MKVAMFAMCLFLAAIVFGQAIAANELRIAAWNLEHLEDTDGEGCVGRSGADYAALAWRIAGLDADIVTFQEMEHAAAAHRVDAARSGTSTGARASSGPAAQPGKAFGACWSYVAMTGRPF